MLWEASVGALCGTGWGSTGKTKDEECSGASSASGAVMKAQQMGTAAVGLVPGKSLRSPRVVDSNYSL